MKKWKIGLVSSISVLTLSLLLYSDNPSKEMQLGKKEEKLTEMKEERPTLLVTPEYNVSIEKSVHLENDLQHQKIYFQVNHADIKEKRFYIDNEEIDLQTDRYYDYTKLKKGKHAFKIVLTNKNDEQQEVVLHFDSYSQALYDNIQEEIIGGDAAEEKPDSTTGKEPLSDTIAPIITFVQDGDKGVRIQIKDESKTTEHYTLNGSPLSVENNYVPYAPLSSNTYTLHVVSTDESGNRSEKSFDFIVDRESPLLNLVYEDVWSKEIDVRIEATDVVSGVKEIKYAKGTQTSAYFATKGTLLNNEALTLTENGDYTFYAIDKKGNTVTKTITLTKIDRVKPTITLEDDNSYQKDHTVTVLASDEHSGIASLEYVWTEEEKTPTSGWETLSAESIKKEGGDGRWYLHIRATDYAGNSAYATTVRYFDNTQPTFNTYLHNYNQIEQNYALSFTFEDNLSLDELTIIKGRFSEDEMKNKTKTHTNLNKPTINLNKYATIKRGEVYTIYVKDDAGNESIGYIDAQSTNFVYATHGGQKDYATILGYTGANVAKLVIPDQLDGAPVKEIADYAFYALDGNRYNDKDARSLIELTGEIVLPQSLERVGDSAFKGNRATINQFYFEKLNYIGRYAFLHVRVNNFTLNDELASIGESAFSSSNVTGTFVVTKESKLETIGEDAFYKNNFSLIKFDSKKKISIDNRAFERNNYIGAQLILNNDFGVIGKRSFNDSNYTTIEINSKNIDEIDDSAFKNSTYYYSDPVDLIIEANIGSIGQYAFANNHFSEIELNGKTIGLIDKYAFQSAIYYSSSGNLTINSTIDVIEESAFNNNKFVNITLNGEKIHTIKDSAFSYATHANALNLIVQSSIDSVGESAFANNYFTHIELNGENINEIQAYAFQRISRTSDSTSLVVESNIKDIGYSAFSSNYFSRIEFNGNKIGVIGEYSFQGITNSSAPGIIVVNSNIDMIKDNAFASNNFKEIHLNGSYIGTIKDYAFQSVSNRTQSDLYINTSIDVIGTSAFANNYFTHIELNGEKIGEIRVYAFQSATKDADLIINSNINTIQVYAFDDNTFSKIVFNGDYVRKIASDAFRFNDYDNATLIINSEIYEMGNKVFHQSKYGTVEFNFNTIGNYKHDTFDFFDFDNNDRTMDFYVKNEDLNINELQLKLHNAVFHLSGDTTKEVYQYALRNQFRIEQL